MNKIFERENIFVRNLKLTKHQPQINSNKVNCIPTSKLTNNVFKINLISRLLCSTWRRSESEYACNLFSSETLSYT